MKRIFVVLVLSAILFCGGSAQAQDIILPLPPPDRQRIDAQLGPGVVGDPLPSQPIADASVYFPLSEKPLVYKVISGAHPGRIDNLGLSRIERPSGKPAWRFQFTPTLTGFIHQTDAGELTMPSVSDSNEGVIVISTPPNPFVPTGMKPGETRMYQQRVSVNYLDDPDDQRFSGNLNGTCTYLGTYRTTVPAGTFPAVLLRMKFAGRVGPAETKDTQYNLFAPGVGLVAMITQERVTAFWLYHIDSTSGKVLMSK